MRTTRLRYWADVNPDTPEFSALTDEDAVGFMPLETVWADTRLDASRTRRKAEVQTGYVRFRRGDVLLPKVTPTFQAARTALVNDLPTAVGAGSTELHVLRARPDSDARMVAYATRTKHFVEEGVTAFQGVAGLQRVPERFVANFVVPDWPLEEQRRIADFLDDQVALLDRAIVLRQQQMDLLAEIGRSRTADAISGSASARPLVAHKEFGPVREGWPVLKIKRVLTQSGVGVVVNPSTYFVEDGLPFVHGSNVRDGWLDLTDVKRLSQAASDLLPRSRLQGGDVLVMRVGYPGRAAVVPEELTGANCASVLLLRPCRSEVLPHWIAAFFYSPQGRTQIDKAQYGAAQGVVNLGDVTEFYLPVPPVDQQQRILDALLARTAADRKVTDLMTKSVALLRERKQSLITAAVTGDLDVATARSVA